ncbi:MAG: TIGR04282 family arsenosugar biosynthesis glycosyltransferase [Thermodesulfobacteriota bacterium]
MNQEKASEIGEKEMRGALALPAETVLLFARYPEPGRVKTRLAADIGTKAAAVLQCLFVEEAIKRLSAGGFHVTLCYTPAARGPDFREWLPGLDLLAQTGEDLGARMKNAFQEVFSRGIRAAVCLGSDAPDLPLEHVALAFSWLKGDGSVLGPAGDGGYYLIGFTGKSFAPEAFSGVAWGGPEVLSRTLSNLRSRGLAPELLPVWRDVDSLGDLADLKRRQDERPVLSPTLRAMLEEIL